jgi:hypothetical protein
MCEGISVAKPVEQIRASVTLEGSAFAFTLDQRDVELGEVGFVPFYSMFGRQFRRCPPSANFRTCVDHWWTAMALSKGQDDYGASNLVLAEFYPHVSTARSLQDIYLDANLHDSADLKRRIVIHGGVRQVETERMYTLPDDECGRLRALAATRDEHAVQQEFEHLFLGKLPDKVETLRHQARLEELLGDCIQVLRSGGTTALQNHVAEKAAKLCHLRKHGGADEDRAFLNLLQYEAKVAFYLCYSNTWVDLIPWLERNCGLQPASKRLMRLWHYQNQPRDNPEDKPGGTRDVFCGQVLSLHPLSAFIFGKPEHCTVLGRWISHPDYDRLEAENTIGTAQEYWNLVATILIAATEYKHVRDQWEASRGAHVRTQSGLVEASSSPASAQAEIAVRMNEYAAEKRILCANCQHAVEFERSEDPDEKPDTAVIWYGCPKCHQSLSIPVSYDELEAFCRPPDG